MLNNFREVPQPLTPPSSNGETSAHPRRSAYAAMSDLQECFYVAGIDTDQVWEFIKSEHGVASRSKWTAPQWARIAAELQGARRDDALFTVLLDRIPCQYFRIHVFTDNPSVCIGRPRDTRKHHIASEWGDFQAIATKNQCTLTVTQGKRTTYYEPKPVRPATPAPETIRTQKPVISQDTNARGEILNMFGDIVEVSA